MKFLLFRAIVCMMASPPSRGAWIEINSLGFAFAYVVVAPLAGGVD